MLRVHLQHSVNCVVDVYVILVLLLLLVLWRGAMAMAFAPLLGAPVAWACLRVTVT